MVAIKDILEGLHTDKEVEIKGWIYRTRSSGKLVFAVIRDWSGTIQATVFKGSVEEKVFEDAEKALVESSVVVKGKAVKDERAPGGYEIQVSDFEVVHFAEVFPISKDKSEEFLLDMRHLWVRSRKLTSVFKIKAALLRGARDWLDENNFFEMTPPIITANACEGGATLFDFKYFGRTAYLSQSAQLYLEALIYSLERVWALTPSFRAEKSRTPRHITEFWHLELETAWADNEENMRIQEGLLCAMVSGAIEKCPEDLEVVGRDINDLEIVKTPFKRMSYDEAVEFLQREGFDFKWGEDLGTAEERALTIDERVPVFVYNYPKECKAFYMKENPDDSRTYLCNDLLAPEGFGEIIGASVREEDNAKLIERLKKENANMADYEWYLDLRKFGSVPHAGFGMGIERVVRWVCKLEHIRDAVPFPRTITRLNP